MHEACTRHMVSILPSFLFPFTFFSRGVPQSPVLEVRQRYRPPGFLVREFGISGRLAREMLPFFFLLIDESMTCFFAAGRRRGHKTVNKVIYGRRGKPCCIGDVSKRRGSS
jgi:hypothetical protein